MLGSPQFQEEVDPGGVALDNHLVVRDYGRDKASHLPRVAMDEMPFEKALHLAAARMQVHVRRQQQPARSQHRIEDLHELAADLVRKIIEQAGAINEVILVGGRRSEKRRVGKEFESR